MNGNRTGHQLYHLHTISYRYHVMPAACSMLARSTLQVCHDVHHCFGNLGTCTQVPVCRIYTSLNSRKHEVSVSDFISYQPSQSGWLIVRKRPVQRSLRSDWSCNLCCGKDMKWLVVCEFGTCIGVNTQAVEAMGYTEPSPIQMAAIPLGLQFRDVIGVAETVCLPCIAPSPGTLCIVRQ